MSRNNASNKRSANDAEEIAWVADEDRFVLQQSKARAVIRAKSGRAEAIDWLCVILGIIDPDNNRVEELEDAKLEIVHPERLFDELDTKGLSELEKSIDTFLVLEKNRSNHDYWQMMKTVCQDRRAEVQSALSSARGIEAVAADVDKILAPKTLAQLEKLESQIKTKLEGGGPIDTDYWEHLLKRLQTYKAKARLRAVTRSIQQSSFHTIGNTAQANINGGQGLESGSLSSHAPDSVSAPVAKRPRNDNDDIQSHTKSAFDREVSRGLGENEEVFSAEEVVSTKDKAKWADEHRPRKPRYFNRVVTGYEWNKYNQTHYDHDNPPPKVVQGYKFNIFYPDLVDHTKAPTYKIEREGGRKRGQSFAPAGEDDTCLIRFIAGAPYEDVAFRIVDKEWDYSAKRERGFKSSFDKGILQLHFQFKKVYYRK